MNYNIIKANDNDIDYVKKAKLYNIFAFAHDLPEDEIEKVLSELNGDLQIKKKSVKEHSSMLF